MIKYEVIEYSNLDTHYQLRQTTEMLVPFKLCKLMLGKTPNSYSTKSQLKNVIRTLRRDLYTFNDKKCQLTADVVFYHKDLTDKLGRLTGRFNYNAAIAGTYYKKDRFKLIRNGFKEAKRRIQNLRNNRKYVDRFNGHLYKYTDYIKGLREVPDYTYMVGLVHDQAGTFTKMLALKKSLGFFMDKKPLTNDKHIGVEIECIMKTTPDLFAKVLAERHPELINNVTLKDDGSIHNIPKDHCPFEVCVMDTQERIAKTVSNVMKVMNEHGMLVNDTCGLHIHLDMRSRDPQKTFKNLLAFQSFMYKLADPKRSKNKFCRKITKREVGDEPNEFVARKMVNRSVGNRSSRYKGINLNAFRKFNTYEIRIHESTTNEAIVNNWIAILVKIADSPEIPTRQIKAAKTVAKFLKLDKNLADYIEFVFKKQKEKKTTVTLGNTVTSSGYYVVSGHSVNPTTITFSTNSSITSQEETPSQRMARIANRLRAESILGEDLELAESYTDDEEIPF